LVIVFCIFIELRITAFLLVQPPAGRPRRELPRPMSRQDLPRRPPPASGDLAAIVAEFNKTGIGPLMLAEVQQVAYQVAARYNAAVYSEIGNWRHGFDDLVQDVISESLLAEGQAKYLIDTSSTIVDFRRLLTRQVKRRLARRRTRTVVDNLLDRARPILDEPAFRISMRHQYVTYAPRDQEREERAATFRELRTASDSITSIPQVRSSKRDRAPTVYATADLRSALLRIADVLPCAFRIRELDQIFRLTLPHLLPGVLDLDRSSMNDRSIGATASGQQASRQLVELLDTDHLLIVACKMAGESDAEVAVRMGMSRRTAGNRKRVTFALLEAVFGPLTEDERLACLDDLTPRAQAALICA
jgi:hypothetical protein